MEGDTFLGEAGRTAEGKGCDIPRTSAVQEAGHYNRIQAVEVAGDNVAVAGGNLDNRSCTVAVDAVEGIPSYRMAGGAVEDIRTLEGEEERDRAERCNYSNYYNFRNLDSQVWGVVRCFGDFVTWCFEAGIERSCWETDRTRK